MDIEKEYTRLQGKMDAILDIMDLNKYIQEADMWCTYWTHANGDNSEKLRRSETTLLNLKTEQNQLIKKYYES